MLNHLIGCALIAASALAWARAFQGHVSWRWLALSGLLFAGLAVGGLADATRRLPPGVATGAACMVSVALIVLVLGGIRAGAAVHRDRCSQFADGCPNPMALLDRTGRFIALNRAAEAIGWSSASLAGKRFVDLWPDDARAAHALRQAADGCLESFSVELSLGDAPPATWHVTVSPLPDRSGSLVAVMTDITGLVFIGNALRERVLHKVRLLDSVDTQIWYLKDPQTYGDVNRAHAEFVGREKSGMRGCNIYDVAARNTVGIIVEGNAEAFETKSQVRSEMRIDDGSGQTRYLSIVKTPRLNDLGEVDYVVCTAQDVTEHRKAEAGLRMQNSAINAASDQIIITDLQGRIEFANPAFLAETGYSFDEIVGRNPRFLKSGRQDVAFYALLWNTILNGRTWHGELTDSRKDGSQFVCQMTITPVKNELGVIERFVAINRNITEKKSFEQRMDHLAHHDALTGLPNRLMMSHRLTRSLIDASKRQCLVAVLFLDLDGFKFINDTMGHRAGDELLKCVAERLKVCCGEEDTLARMGGDEFLIVLPAISKPENAAKVARRILKAVRKGFDLDGQDLFVSTSIGISLHPADGSDVETLVKNADAAMYYAKEQGRDAYYFYGQELNTAAAERVALENSLRRAVERQEFVVYYQPRVCVATGRILGVEALVRWRHPELGLVYPDRFVGIAEETGLIGPISEWVLRQACSQNKEWQNAGLPPIQVAVNLSARQFQRRNLLTTIKSALKESQLDPVYLEIELTESALMQQPEQAAGTLNKLKAMGIHVSVDDFGTGYSSLSYLKKFPVDALKIDRSFVGDITTNPDDAAITRAVIAMAHSLNLRVVAEGVETLEQLQFLFDLGCDEMQGYFVSAAVSAEEMVELLVQLGETPNIRLAA